MATNLFLFGVYQKSQHLHYMIKMMRPCYALSGVQIVIVDIFFRNSLIRVIVGHQHPQSHLPVPLLNHHHHLSLRLRLRLLVERWRACGVGQTPVARGVPRLLSPKAHHVLSPARPLRYLPRVGIDVARMACLDRPHVLNTH